MKTLEIHIVPTKVSPIRIQEYAVGIFQYTRTRSAVKKAIKKGLILVNEEVVNTSRIVNGGEKITLLEDTIRHKPFDYKLEVLYEDEFIAIIDKPAGMLVSGNSYATIDNALTENLTPSQEKDAVRPRPVHRLDYPTSGLLMIGKTAGSIQLLSKQFEFRKIKKTYHAVTIGQMEGAGIISKPIDQKESVSHFEVLQSISSDRFEFLNLVKLLPETGRKHQLRRHMASISNPILGDREYGKEGYVLKGNGLYLCASQLIFEHPFLHEEVHIHKQLPKKFLKLFPEGDSIKHKPSV